MSAKLTINVAKIKYSVTMVENVPHLLIKYGNEGITLLQVPDKVTAMKAVAKNHTWFERAIDRYMMLGIEIANPFMASVVVNA